MPSYDLLIKGGHVIDAANGIDEVMDVGIAGRVVAGVAKDIPVSAGRRVIDASGMFVTPGLIDIHAHTAVYSGAMFPEEMCFPYGVTTMVDCGGSGWRNFDQFNDEIIKKSAVRVFALLNIVGKGMDGDVEQDVEDMDAELTAAKIRQRSDIIVGVKIAHFQGKGWESIDRGVEAARLSDTFALVDQNAKPTRTFEDMLKRLRPGDGTTHCFGYGKPMIGNDGKVKQHYIDARKRGIKFDVGHGNNSFSFSMAKPALDQGFPPDTISTDMHRASLHTSRAQMTEVMSKFLAMGMPMAEVVARSTWEPAKWINHTELGTLTPGALADVSILEFQDRPAGLSDSGPTGYRIMRAEGRLINQMTIKDGVVRFDYDGMGKDDWDETPPTDLNLP